MQKKVSTKMLFIYICLLLAVLGMEAGGLQYHLLLIISYLGGSACLGLLFMARSLPVLLLVYGVMGFFFTPIWTLIMSEAGHLDQQNSGRISGIMVAGCGIGGAVAPTVFGLLADRVGLHASIGFVLAITVTGLVISFVYACKQKNCNGGLNLWKTAVLLYCTVEEKQKQWYDVRQFKTITIAGGQTDEPEKQKFPDIKRLYTGGDHLPSGSFR